MLGEYCGHRKRIKVRYNECGHISDSRPDYLVRGRGCPICNNSPKMSESECISYLNEQFPKFKYVSGYKNTTSRIKLKHECGTVVEYSWANLYKGNCKCPLCDGKSTILCVGINDIATTDEWMIPLLHDKEDAYKYKRWSDKRIKFDCPSCGRTLTKMISAVTAAHKVPCNVCSVGMSYPQKFMAEILDYLKIDYIPEFSDSWSQGRRYDFCFSVNSIRYLLEMDGYFHFNDNHRNGMTKIEAQEIDKHKDDLARENGFEIIRIDCNYYGDAMNYILNNIKNSILSDILNLSKVDFDVCNKRAQKTIPVLVAEVWNSGVHLIKDIAKTVGINRNTVSYSLRKASLAGLIAETPDQIREIVKSNSHKTVGLVQRKPIRCNETGAIFKTVTDALKAHPGRISAYLAGKVNYSSKLPDGTRLTWTKLYA